MAGLQPFYALHWAAERTFSVRLQPLKLVYLTQNFKYFGLSRLFSSIFYLTLSLQ